MSNPTVRRAIVMFSIFKFSGLTRLQAVERFLSTSTCKSFGDALTVGHVFTFAELGGYESGV